MKISSQLANNFDYSSTEVTFYAPSPRYALRASAVQSTRSASQESLKASRIILSTRYRHNSRHEQHNADHHEPVNLFFAAQKERGETDNEERRGIDQRGHD